MQSKMIKKMELLIIVMVFVYGIICINKWIGQQQFYKEGNTLEELGRNDLTVGEYVSFYIEDYVNKETHTYLGNEYDIYTVLIERKISEHEDIYIQVMVKDQKTKEKLNTKGLNKVYFHGEVIGAPFGGFSFNKDIYKDKNIDSDEVDYYGVGKLILNIAIMQTEVPNEGYRLYLGIALVIFAIVVYRLIGGIKSCVSNVEIKSEKYGDYNCKHAANIYNIRNEWICENDNLKRLQAEKRENNKVCNIMIVMFIIGVLLFIGDTSILKGSILWVVSFIIKLISFVLMFIGAGGIWSKFINSSNELAVKIARKKGKRSLYLEIEECKKNIEELERIMEKQNIEEIENMFK